MTVSSAPVLPPPPTPAAGAGPTSELGRTAFRYLNRWFMVPIHRAGLAAWLGTPLTGWQLLLTTTGRHSGLPRPTPLGYLVADGAAWVLAGFGPSTLWYRNLLAEPRVEVLMPARQPFQALAEEVVDPVVRARIIPPLVRTMRLPGATIGSDPATTSDERILVLLSRVPLVRLSPVGPALVAGADDPGGLGWVWRQTVAAVASLVLLVLLRLLLRRSPSEPG